MESFLNRYRNITVLLLVIFAQLVLLAVQVKNDQDVYLIRVWTVTAVSPVARVLEFFRGGGSGFVRNYITLHDATAENRRLKDEVGRLKMENTFLHNELESADRAKALQMFAAKTPSKLLPATINMTGAGSNSKVVFVNRGSLAGVMRGMGVVTPDGIVGKVIAAYPTSSEVLLINDPDFAAGVISQKAQVRGTLKGQGTPMCKVDYVPSEEKVDVGEWFYTSGDDRVFPRGFRVGVAKIVRPGQPGQPFKDILVEPSAMQRGLESVLIVISGVHQEIPKDSAPASQSVYIAPPPPGDTATGSTAPSTGTEADKLRLEYKAAGDAQNHTFGEGQPRSKPPDFTKVGLPAAQGGGRGPGVLSGAPAKPPAASPTGTGRAIASSPAPGVSNGQPSSAPQAPASVLRKDVPAVSGNPAPGEAAKTPPKKQAPNPPPATGDGRGPAR